MEWYETHLAPATNGPRLARWFMWLAAAAALLLLGWVGAAAIRWAV